MAMLPQINFDAEREPDMCFACGRKNPIGLKLSFRREGDSAVAEFTPAEVHQGWSGIVHGGIIHLLLDEAMSYAAIFAGAVCITAKMESRWRRPALVGETLVIRSQIAKNSRRLLEIQASIELKDGTRVAEALGTLYRVNKEDRFLNV